MEARRARGARGTGRLRTLASLAAAAPVALALGVAPQASCLELATARAASPPRKPSPPAPPPLAPLPMTPSIPRVRLELLPTGVVVIEEVNLPRGEWQGEGLDFYAAFGAPGLPRALDARIVGVADGALEPEADEPGEALPADRVARRPASAHPLLGRDTMAGVVIHLKKEPLERALREGDMAAIRVRSVLDLPGPDAAGARSLVVRLGASRGAPLTLGRVSLVARPGAPAVERAEAHLCGPEASATPLAVGLLPRRSATQQGPASPQGQVSGGPVTPLAPVLATRHATDDLCLRFWIAASIPGAGPTAPRR